MAKAPRVAQQPETSIEHIETAPRPRDAFGFELDEWGLPLIGPERVRRLAGRPDPHDDLEGWQAALTPVASADPLEDVKTQEALTNG